MGEDTIVARATPRGAAPRGVVRLSGPRAIEIAATVFSPSPPAARRFGWMRGRLRLGRSRLEVPASLLFGRGPGSYTGEDSCELHLEGAPLLLGIVEELLRRAGARPAEPGEFTRRAFLSGRMDLTRAEGVAAIIHAQDEAERRRSLSLLEGGMERRLARVRDRVLRILVPVELSLDFSDQDVDIPLPERAEAELLEGCAELRQLAQGAAAASRQDEDLQVVLEGPANAGKSSLFNRLVGEDAALVTTVPGTTRDVLEGVVRIGTRRLRLVDTAGHDVTEGEADARAHAARKRRLREADLVLEVHAGPGPVAPVAARRLRVHTHRDLHPDAGRPGELWVSNVTGEGLEALREALGAVLQRGTSSSGGIQVTARIAEALAEAARALGEAAGGIREGREAELVAAELRQGLEALRQLTGEDYTQSVLDRIFSSFCIGK